MLSKSSALLAIGLGEAGRKIFRNQFSGKIENMLEKGNKVYCIFGFCNLVNFRQISDSLDNSILAFVNKISNIVHRNIYHHLGFVNKNLGDVFFIVWKFKPKEIINQGKEPVLENTSSFRRHSTPLDAQKWILSVDPNNKMTYNRCDYALISFVKIFWEIKQRLNPKKSSKMKNFNINDIDMKFGLHCGWAIEGAIGSSSKIDTR